MADVDVSVFCCTYNHEKYIAECLESLVHQNGVNYEILVHDDASTDGTAGIVKKYADKYPNIIRPIFQSENQYSKKIKISMTILQPMARGRYFAFCEGDDYWIDNDKLAKQLKLMDENEDCSICLHAVENVNSVGEDLNVTCPNVNIPSGKYSSDEFLWWAGEFFHLTSFFIRREAYANMVTKTPDFMGMSMAGDKSILLYMCAFSPVLFINEKLSCYRQGVANSWTQRMNSNGEKSYVNYCKNRLQVYENFNTEYTKKIYDAQMQETMKKTRYQIAMHTAPYKDIFQKEFHDLLKQETYKTRLLLFTKAYMPFLYKWIRQIRCR